MWHKICILQNWIVNKKTSDLFCLQMLSRMRVHQRFIGRSLYQFYSTSWTVSLWLQFFVHKYNPKRQVKISVSCSRLILCLLQETFKPEDPSTQIIMKLVKAKGCNLCWGIMCQKYSYAKVESIPNASIRGIY